MSLRSSIMAVSPRNPLDAAIAAIVAATIATRSRCLGPHADDGVAVVRAFYPAAERVELQLVASGAIRRWRSATRPACSDFASTSRGPTTGCASPIPAIT